MQVVNCKYSDFRPGRAQQPHAAADAQGETGQGFTNYFAAIGIVETVAIFAMVFSMLAIFQVPVAEVAATAAAVVE